MYHVARMNEAWFQAAVMGLVLYICFVEYLFLRFLLHDCAEVVRNLGNCCLTWDSGVWDHHLSGSDTTCTPLAIPVTYLSYRRPVVHALTQPLSDVACNQQLCLTASPALSSDGGCVSPGLFEESSFFVSLHVP